MVDYITRESDKFMLRLPDGMRDRIKKSAQTSRRSMNAEIIDMIEDALSRHEFMEELAANREPEPEVPIDIEDVVKRMTAAYEHQLRYELMRVRLNTLETMVPRVEDKDIPF